MEKDKYLSQLPNVSEYKARYQVHSANCYLQQQTSGVPKDLSTSLYVLNNTLNNTTKPRSTSSTLREPQTRDVLDVVYTNMFNKPKDVPRTLYYLGKVPTDGSNGVYRMKDFETLMPPVEYDQVVKQRVKLNVNKFSNSNATEKTNTAQEQTNSSESQVQAEVATAAN